MDDAWRVTLNGQDYFGIAGDNSALQPEFVDVQILDDDAPGVFVTQTDGDTKVTEASDVVLLGDGVVTGPVAATSEVIGVSAENLTAAQSIRSNTSKILISAVPSLDDFKTAYLVLSGSVTTGERWAVTLNNTLIEHVASSTDTLATIATSLQNKLTTTATGLVALSTTEFVKFTGDFGLQPLLEVNSHSSFFDAQNLDLGKWNTSADPEYDDPNTPQRPHITVLATGNGEPDVYSFTITEEMFIAGGYDPNDTSTTGTIEARFDIDHGFETGDPVFWGSQFRLYDESGLLLSQANGYQADQPDVGSDFTDDAFLEFSFEGTQDTKYFLEVVTSTGGGLPVGVDYQLRVAIEHHPVADFIFGPSSVYENETAQALNGDPTVGAQDIDSADNFFTFADSTVGNAEFGGVFDFTTPYARVKGSGDGTFDLYQFTVTDAMLASQQVEFDLDTSGLLTDPDEGPFFTFTDFTLNGRVSEGDQWSLGSAIPRLHVHGRRRRRAAGRRPRPEEPDRLRSFDHGRLDSQHGVRDQFRAASGDRRI